MKIYKRCSLFLCGALFMISAAGCGYRAETENGTSPYAAATSMESTPVVDYAVPQMSANILVDLRGYSAVGRKKAAVKGSGLPEDFQIIDVETGEMVYQGSINNVSYNEDLEFYMGYADFSDFTREGTYYLKCDIIGQSYRFEIREQHYPELFSESCTLLMSECEAGTLSVADALSLLEAFEWYGSVFPDKNGDQEPDVLAAMRSWVTHKEASGVEDKETALYAAFLAKFSYNYQGYDRQYATDCLKRASTVFGQVQTTVNKDADIFWALTELYRATGLWTYRNQIVGYKSLFEDTVNYFDEPGYLYGGMTYMVTRQTVDVEMCEDFMEQLLTRAEDISMRCDNMIDPVTARNNGTAELLKCAIEVSCANYVMNIYQYTNILEEFLHYLMGENLESVSFYEQSEDWSEYVLLLAQLAANVPDSVQK